MVDERRRGREPSTERLLEVARELFAERGPAAVSLREVARVAGLNHGLIHHYVGSREDLVTQVFARAAAESEDVLRDVETLDDALAALRHLPDDGWARMLAWSVLSDAVPDLAGTPTPALARIIEADGGDPEETRLAVAADLVGMIAAELFADWARTTVGLQEMPAEEFRERLDRRLSAASRPHRAPDVPRT